MFQQHSTMIVQEYQDQRLPLDVPSGQITGRQIQPMLPSSNCDVHAGNSYTPNTPEYTETDYLLPVALYGISRPRRTARTEGAPVETVCSMLVQILVPFLLAGLGTVFAGLLLEVVQVRKEKDVDTCQKDDENETGCGDIKSDQYPPHDSGIFLFFFFCIAFSWQSWDVFQEITALLILVPALLGMKGNLELTLASRLSTAVSLFLPP